ncbi:MAG: amino acid adenylation domain-containing protein [Candidatus Aminicenantes bacterium]|jgi:amino acid adenylation domain-containing protein
MKTKIFQVHLNDSLSRYKEHVAIECGSRRMNYTELENRTNHIANRILSKGISKETLIGILIDDRVEFICALIGIVMAGCVVVPMDSTHPTDRLEVMLHATNTKFVIGDQTNLDRFIANDENTNATAAINPSFEFIRMEDLFPNKESSWLTNRPKIQYTPADKIYIYFTSGTTGLPRAILGKNKSLLHFVRWETQTFGVDENFRVSQLTSPGFDAFLRDIFVPICAGGTVCCPDSSDVIVEAQKLMNWIENSGIHLIHCVPSLFRLLISNGLTNHQFKELKYILFSGERINPADLVNWYNTFDERIQLVNLWGTSETTLAKTCHFIQKNDVNQERIPVGKPIKGAIVVVLDKYKKICGEQVKGELYIRTPFRTFGYLNNPELTHQRFIQNPFNDDPNDLLHVTGDFGQLLPDGSIDFIGRTDRQVKIRGIRIELEEIENLLLKYPQVKEAVVIKKVISDTNEFLCAYVSADLTVEPDIDTNDDVDADLRETAFISALFRYLSRKLPEYMIPAYIMNMENIPRKPNGKINYNRLPDPLKVEKRKYIAPKNDVEKKLALLWSDILKIEKIGVNTHFFELGGNSLNIMTLITNIHKEFDVRISLAEIFDNLTIVDQANIIIEAKKDIHISIKPGEKKEYYPLSSAQRGLYFMHKIQPEDLSYNNLITLEIKGNLDKEKLEETFNQLIKRHESLRTSFMELEGKPLQEVNDNITFQIDCYETNNGDIHQVIEEFKKPFDLSRAPLLRVGLITVDQEKSVLMTDMHHIITDGTSLGVFEREFMALYDGRHLPGLKIQYKDYCQWLNNETIRERMKCMENYWVKEFENPPPLLNLPMDFPRPVVKSIEGAVATFEIGEEQTAGLEALAVEEDFTMYMVMLAIANVMLSKLSGQEDIVVGTGVAGRIHSDLRNIMGLFVNILPLRNYPQRNKTFIEFLREIKERTLKAFENQEYQFEDLVNKLVVRRDPSRSPLFDVTFELQNIEIDDFSIPGSNIKLHREENGRIDAKFDLSIIGRQVGKRVFYGVEYRPKLFKKETIETFGKYFEDVIACVLENKNIPLNQIQISHGFIEKELINPRPSFDF